MFRKHKTKKKHHVFFPGTKMLLLDVFGWSDRWAQRDVIESILKKCDTNRQSMHKLTLRDISNIYIYTYKFPTHFFIWYFSMVNVGKCSMYWVFGCLYIDIYVFYIYVHIHLYLPVLSAVHGWWIFFQNLTKQFKWGVMLPAPNVEDAATYMHLEL